jgi:hypothetical protein
MKKILILLISLLAVLVSCTKSEIVYPVAGQWAHVNSRGKVITCIQIKNGFFKKVDLSKTCTFKNNVLYGVYSIFGDIVEDFDYNDDYIDSWEYIDRYLAIDQTLIEDTYTIQNGQFKIGNQVCDFNMIGNDELVIDSETYKRIEGITSRLN